MKKMIAIAVAIFLVGFVITATEVMSQFVPNLHLRGATLSSVSSDLLLSNLETPPLDQYQAFGELKGAQNLIPGGEETGEFFWVWNKNQSSAVRLIGKFLPGDGDWDKLAPLIEVKVTTQDQESFADWVPLAQLASSQTEIMSRLNADENKKIVVRYRMITQYPSDPDGDGPLSAGDFLGSEIQNLTTSSVGLELSTTRLP
jgi:hypothetical protein